MPRRIDLKTLVCVNIMDGAEGPMELEYRFMVGIKDATYRMVFSEDGRVIDESLKYVSSRGRTIEYYHVTSGERGPRLNLHKDAFPDGGIESSLFQAVPQYWGKHTLMSLSHTKLVTGTADTCWRRIPESRR